MEAGPASGRGSAPGEGGAGAGRGPGAAGAVRVTRRLRVRHTHPETRPAQDAVRDLLPTRAGRSSAAAPSRARAAPSPESTPRPALSGQAAPPPAREEAAPLRGPGAPPPTGRRGAVTGARGLGPRGPLSRTGSPPGPRTLAARSGAGRRVAGLRGGGAREDASLGCAAPPRRAARASAALKVRPPGRGERGAPLAGAERARSRPGKEGGGAGLGGGPAAAEYSSGPEVTRRKLTTGEGHCPDRTVPPAHRPGRGPPGGRGAVVESWLQRHRVPPVRRGGPARGLPQVPVPRSPRPEKLKTENRGNKERFRRPGAPMVGRRPQTGCPASQRVCSPSFHVKTAPKCEERCWPLGPAGEKRGGQAGAHSGSEG